MEVGRNGQYSFEELGYLKWEGEMFMSVFA